MNYKELIDLSTFCENHKATVTCLPDKYLAGVTSFPLIQLTIQEKQFTFFVDDEYDDLTVNSNELSVCIALRALESYDYADDYLVWCTQHNFDASIDEVRSHY